MITTKSRLEVINQIKEKNLIKYEKEIVRFLDDEDEFVRNQTITLLGIRWKLLKYKNKLSKILESDKSNWCRICAANALGILGGKYKDRWVVKVLVKNLKKESQPKDVKIEIYLSILGIYGISKKQIITFTLNKDKIKIKRDLDWKFIKTIDSLNYNFNKISISKFKMPVFKDK